MAKTIEEKAEEYANKIVGRECLAGAEGFIWQESYGTYIKIATEQRKKDIELFGEWLRYELTSTMDEAIKNGNAIEYIIYKFKKSMEEEQWNTNQ